MFKKHLENIYKKTYIKNICTLLKNLIMKIKAQYVSSF